MFVLYDLGAEGGIPLNWKTKEIQNLLDEIKIVAFDLEDKKILTSNDHFSLTLVDKIISDTQGPKDFYIPKRDSGSSLYPFNTKYTYLHHKNYHQLDKKIKVETTTLETLIENNSIQPADMIKMDIQGAELSALKGLGKYLDSVHVLEIEVELLEVYDGQPTYGEIHQFLTSAGLHLQDMHLSKSFLTNGKKENYYQKKINRNQVNAGWTPQVYAGDALYVKDLDSVMMLDLEEQIRHLKCLIAYKCFDRALLIVDKSEFCEQIKTSEFYTQLTKSARKGYIFYSITNFISRLFRKIGLKAPLQVDKSFPWIQRSFPNI